MWFVEFFKNCFVFNKFENIAKNKFKKKQNLRVLILILNFKKLIYKI
jgi:hypothetical protein